MRTIAACLALLAFAEPLLAQEQAPLQADLQVRVKYRDKEIVFFRSGLESGDAALKGGVANLPGRETCVVFLRFDYRTKADIVLDEIISQIVITTSDLAGNEFSRVTIDPNTVPLNPNRVPLYYSATLYKPPSTGPNSYLARIQVFGNYE